MASGKVHNAVSVIASVPTGLAVTALYGPGPGAISALGCLLGIAVGPDNDMLTITEYEWWIVKKTMGLGYVWLGYWGPYATIFKHRSFWSHFPVVSTAIRILYIIPILYIISLVINIPFWDFLWDTFWWIGVGLMVSDTLHWILDNVFRH